MLKTPCPVIGLRGPMATRSVLLPVLIAVLLGLAERPARAIALDDGCINDPVCRQHYDTALELFQDGRYEAALELDPTVLVDLARARMPFGKHQGQRLIKLPEAYLVWFTRTGLPACFRLMPW